MTISPIAAIAVALASGRLCEAQISAGPNVAFSPVTAASLMARSIGDIVRIGRLPMRFGPHDSWRVR